jgi:hypothetical protein
MLEDRSGKWQEIRPQRKVTPRCCTNSQDTDLRTSNALQLGAAIVAANFNRTQFGFWLQANACGKQRNAKASLSINYEYKHSSWY